MSAYKIIALDMDGTLLSSNKHILKETREAIGKAVRAGKDVVIATGRAVSEVEDCSDGLEGIRYAVCASGAVVYDRLKQRIIYRKGFEEALQRTILRTAVEEDAMAYCTSNGKMFAEAERLKHLEDYNMDVYSDMVNRVFVKVENIWETCVVEGMSLEKINLYSKTVSMQERLFKKLQGLPVTIAFAEGNSLEISPEGVTKAFGLQRLCEHLSLSSKELIAVGDADNDKEMLKYAGLSVAMGNAVPAIRNMCDVIVADNDHNGCAEAIMKYLLEKERT